MAEGSDTGSSFKSMKPEDITAQGQSMEFLVLTQMNRINWLLSILSSQRYDRKERVALLRAIKNALRCLETMLRAYSDNGKWEDFGLEIKAKMSKKYSMSINRGQRMIRLGLLDLKYYNGEEKTVPDGLDIYNELLCEWYDKLVLHLSKTPLLPLEKRLWDLDEGLMDAPA